ncbi:oligosaccharide flippase family protein [Chloroflexota bacterium]
MGAGQGGLMSISIIDVARNSLKFSTVQAIFILISLPVSIYVATILVPEEYGVYGLLGLWTMYATLINPGLLTAGYREVPVLLGKGEEKEALRIQNIIITSDMLYSILPCIVILGASLFFSEPIFRFGLILIAVGYGIKRFVGYWDAVNFMRQNFNIAAKGRLLAAITPPLIIVASTYWLKVYALLIAPIFAAIVLGIYYWRKGPINFHFTLDWKETVRLLKIGIVLSVGTIVFWSFRLADRTIISSTLPLEQLGLYTFAIGFIMTILGVLTNFTNVLQPILYRELGKASSILEGFKDTKRIAVYLALGSAVLIPAAQLGFYLVVSLIATKYIGSVPIFYTLSYYLYLASIAPVPAIVLASSLVNKQKYSLIVYSIGLALNIIFNLLVVKLSFGVVGVAWVTVFTQGLATLTIYYLAKNHMVRNKWDYFRFQIAMWAPFLFTIPFYFLHNYLNQAVPNVWTFTGISLVAQVILWAMLIGLFYRAYISKNDFKIIMQEINTAIGNRLPIKRAGSE